MSKPKYSHTGLLRGKSSAYPDSVVLLRPTKLYWVVKYMSRWTNKFYRESGRQVHVHWPRYSLDIGSIRPLGQEVK